MRSMQKKILEAIEDAVPEDVECVTSFTYGNVVTVRAMRGLEVVCEEHYQFNNNSVSYGKPDEMADGSIWYNKPRKIAWLVSRWEDV